MNAVPPIISQQPPPLPPSKKPFAFQAAQASLLAPAIAFGIGIVVNVGLSGQSSPLVGIITGSVSILLIVSGFIFGVIALAGIPRHGKKGIFGRGIAGICINGILIALMIISIPMYKKDGGARQSDQQQQKTGTTANTTMNYLNLHFRHWLCGAVLFCAVNIQAQLAVTVRRPTLSGKKPW